MRDHMIFLFNPRHPEANNSILRPLLVEDVNKDYLDGLNNSIIRRWLAFSNKQKASLDSVRNYVQDNLNDRNAVLFGFYIDGKLRGTVRLHNIDSDEPNIGIAIFDLSIWGKSWAAIILQTVAEFGFKELKLKSIFAGIDKDNIGSIRAFGKAGFQIIDDHKIKYEMGTAIMMVCQNHR